MIDDQRVTKTPQARALHFHHLRALHATSRSVGGTPIPAATNAKRSVELKLKAPHGWQSAGNVTIPPSHSIPKVGEIVEIRYLYAFPESGVLYQPVYLGTRPDLDASECDTNQLKFKPVEDEEA